MLSSERITYLVSRYLLRELSPEESEELNNWRKESQQNESLFSGMINPSNLQKMLNDSLRIQYGWDKLSNILFDSKSE